MSHTHSTNIYQAFHIRARTTQKESDTRDSIHSLERPLTSVMCVREFFSQWLLLNCSRQLLGWSRTSYNLRQMIHKLGGYPAQSHQTTEVTKSGRTHKMYTARRAWTHELRGRLLQPDERARISDHSIVQIRSELDNPIKLERPTISKPL